MYYLEVFRQMVCKPDAVTHTSLKFKIKIKIRFKF